MRSKMRILLAEDDVSIQKIAGLTLERVGHHEVVYAKNGKETLDLARNGKFDLILLDIMMPELDGFECCRELKKDASTRSIPIIFLTARAQSNEIKKGIELGAIGYIVKPFDPMTLPQQIEAILREETLSRAS